jgi:hypothetical protein
MERFAILLGYFDKQMVLIKRLYSEITVVDLSIYDKRFLFALRTQQFYTAIEDLFKQIAKSFENHIENMANFHKEILVRMNTEIPKIRPAVLSRESLSLLDKIRSFRHFIRHAYDCELDEKELRLIQEKLTSSFQSVEEDLRTFRDHVKKLAKPGI